MMTQKFNKGHHELLSYPLSTASVIGTKTSLVNPSNGERHGVPEPFWPGSPEYTEETNALVSLAADVEAQKWPSWYLDYCGVSSELSPILEAASLSQDDPRGCASAVRMDQPQELWMALLAYARSEAIGLNEQVTGVPFLETNVNVATHFHIELEEAMRRVFQVKYFYGLLRPEEYFASMNFTAYPEGCPNHPSYPAGHGVLAGIAYKVFCDHFAPTQDQRHEVLTATRQFAHFRDFARVHTRQDSLTGWRFGAGEIDANV